MKQSKLFKCWALLLLALSAGQLIRSQDFFDPVWVANLQKNQASSAGGGSSLLTDLAAYWKLEDLNDSVGGNTLVNNGSVTFVTGKVNNGSDFEVSSSQSLTASDSASLSSGDIDFTVALWTRIESMPNNNSGRDLVAKGTTGAYEWAVRLNNSATVIRFQFIILNAAQSFGIVTANNFGTPVVDTWYFIEVNHDAAGNTINIRVNNGTADSAAYTLGCFDSAGGLSIGRLNPSNNYYDGIIDEVGFWKRLLTDGERATLYNSDTGTTYPFP